MTVRNFGSSKMPLRAIPIYQSRPPMDVSDLQQEYTEKPRNQYFIPLESSVGGRLVLSVAEAELVNYVVKVHIMHNVVGATSPSIA
jgi:hypothetical protein